MDRLTAAHAPVAMGDCGGSCKRRSVDIEWCVFRRPCTDRDIQAGVHESIPRCGANLPSEFQA
jgi:hypothetical protein